MNWINHIEFIILMVTMIGGIYLLNAKIDRKIKAQSTKTDNLYEYFIEMLKTRKK